MKYSVGIGLTNNCNLKCAHCYRDQQEISNITLNQIEQLCSALPIQSIGMGTGENILNPEFLEIISFLSKREIKLSVASNGLTLNSLPDDYLKFFHDVEVSIDFPTKEDQDKFRGKGNWDYIMQAIERCKDAKIELTILTVMMSINYDSMDKLVDLARSYGVNLRISTFQSVKTNEYHMSYDEFWEGYRILLESSDLISCSEPVVRAVLGFDDVYSPCGYKSIRINPFGEVIPCVYWGGFDEFNHAPHISDLVELGEKIFKTPSFEIARQIPSIAKNCQCQGGCASRRALNGNLNAHDEYCPWVRGDQIEINWSQASSANLVRINNNCTTIVK